MPPIRRTCLHARPLLRSTDRSVSHPAPAGPRTANCSVSCSHRVRREPGEQLRRRAGLRGVSRDVPNDAWSTIDHRPRDSRPGHGGSVSKPHLADLSRQRPARAAERDPRREAIGRLAGSGVARRSRLERQRNLRHDGVRPDADLRNEAAQHDPAEAHGLRDDDGARGRARDHSGCECGGRVPLELYSLTPGC